MRYLYILLPLLLLAAPVHAKPLKLAYSLLADAPVAESFDALGPDGFRALPGQTAGKEWDSAWSVEVHGLKPKERHDRLDPSGVGPATPGGFNGGPVAGADRSLGALDSGGRDRSLTMHVRNDTGAALGSFNLYFDAEFWAHGDAYSWGGVQAYVSVTGTKKFKELPGSFEAVYVTPDSVAGPGWMDGNANAVRGMGGSVDLGALGLAPVAPGASLWVRFHMKKGLKAPDAVVQAVGKKKAGKLGTGVAVFVDNVAIAPPGVAVTTGGQPASIPALGAGSVVLLVGGMASLGITRRRRS